MTACRPSPTIGETSDIRPYVECVTASALNIANAHDCNRHPATAVEREALRTDSGISDTSGATLAQAASGLTKRYGIPSIETTTWADFTLGVATGKWFIVFGLYSALPYHFRRFEPAGTFLHATAVGPNDATSAWWIDPLGPDGYGGESIDLVSLKAYMASGGYDALGVTGGDMLAVVTLTPFAAWRGFTVAAGTTLNGYDPAKPGQVVLSQKFATTSTAHADAEVAVSWPGTVAPPVPNGSPFLRVVDGPYKGLLIVKAQVILDKAPVVVDPLQADVDAANAKVAKAKALAAQADAAIQAL